MEKKLAEYRARQEKLNRIQRFQNNVKNLFSFISKRNNVVKDGEQLKSNNKFENARTSVKSTHLKKRNMEISHETKSLIIPEDELSIDEESLSDSIWCCSWLQMVYYFLCFILWCTVYTIFIKLQFGTVFFIVSALIFMYLNTRTTPKKTGEVSAYSVFNEGCVSIDGTLKAEQLEREIMFGAGL